MYRIVQPSSLILQHFLHPEKKLPAYLRFIPTCLPRYPLLIGVSFSYNNWIQNEYCSVCLPMGYFWSVLYPSISLPKFRKAVTDFSILFLTLKKQQHTFPQSILRIVSPSYLTSPPISLI